MSQFWDGVGGFFADYGKGLTSIVQGAGSIVGGIGGTLGSRGTVNNAQAAMIQSNAQYQLMQVQADAAKQKQQQNLIIAAVVVAALIVIGVTYLKYK
jgi:hypothetical protein